MTTTAGNKLIFLALVSFILYSSANAQVLGVGPISGRVYVMGGPPPVVPVPVPVAVPEPVPVPVPVPKPVPVKKRVVVPVPVVPTYSYVPTPEASNIYSPPGYPTEIPVATSPNGCAMYVDPYDLFGQIFGGADLVQSCWRPVY